MVNGHSDTLSGRMAKIPVQVSVRLCGRSISLNEFLNWTPETVIAFDQPASAPVEICAGQHVIGRGQAVKVGSKIGLRLLQVSPESTLNR